MPLNTFALLKIIDMFENRNRPKTTWIWVDWRRFFGENFIYKQVMRHPKTYTTKLYQQQTITY